MPLVELDDGVVFPPPPEAVDGLYELDTAGALQRFHPLPGVKLVSLAVGDDGAAYLAGWSQAEVFVRRLPLPGGFGWTTPLPGLMNISTSIAISDGAPGERALYLGGEHGGPSGPGVTSGEIVSFSRDGQHRWSVDPGGAPCGSIAVDAGGAPYVTICNDPVRILGLETDGATRLDTPLDEFSPFWFSTPGGQPAYAVVLGADERIYLGSRDGHLYILRP